MEWVTLNDEDTRLFYDTRDELERSTARIVAIGANSLIEDILTSILMRSLNHASVARATELVDVMFAAGGAIADFNTKIDYAFFLGLMSDAACQELHSIYAIRREFAYRAAEPTFDDPSTLSRCAALKRWEEVEISLYDAALKMDGRLALCIHSAGQQKGQTFAAKPLFERNATVTPRARFISACLFYITSLLVIRNYSKPYSRPLV